MLVGCIVIVVVAPVLGMLAILVGSLGLCVCGILSWIYLYRTAKVFRGYEVR